MRRTTHRRPSFALPREEPSPARAGRRTLYRYRVAVVREAAYPCYDALSVSSPETTARFVRSLLGDYDREVLGVLFLDVRQRPIGIHFASIGSAKRTVAEPPEVLRAALAANACSFLLLLRYRSKRSYADSRITPT